MKVRLLRLLTVKPRLLIGENARSTPIAFVVIQRRVSIHWVEKAFKTTQNLTLKYYGLTEADLDVPVSGHGVYGVPAITTAREIIARLRKAYCSGFGVEFMNINDPVKKNGCKSVWKRCRIDRYCLSQINDTCFVISQMRRTLNASYISSINIPRRFSLEGAEPLIPLLAVLIDTIGDRGAERVMLGMAHRGRLNVLSKIFATNRYSIF